MSENHEVVTAIFAKGERYGPGHILTAKQAKEAGIDTEQFKAIGALKPTQKDPEKAAGAGQPAAQRGAGGKFQKKAPAAEGPAGATDRDRGDEQRESES